MVKDVNNKQNKIAVCFWYGKVYPRIIDYIMLFGIIFSLIPVPIIVYMSVTQKSFALIIVAIMCLANWVCSLWLFDMLKRMRKGIKTALTDAVEVEAISYRSNKEGNKDFVFYKDARFTVEFFYKGERVKITSSTPTLKNAILGYKAFLPYENKKINILYSPSQSHVLILNK